MHLHQTTKHICEVYLSTCIDRHITMHRYVCNVGKWTINE